MAIINIFVSSNLNSTFMYEVEYEEAILRGDSWDGYEFIITRDVDYTGSTIKAEIRTKEDGQILVSKDITPVVATNGLIQFNFTMTAEETSALRAGNCRADIQITKGGEIKTPILFKFNVKLDTTK